jgi:hypothetical protein
VNRLGYQVRLSAISGIQSAFQILFVVVAMIPVRFIISWIFDRHATVDWKASLIVGCSITTLWYIAVCVSTFADLRREAARGRKPRQTFPASAFLTGLYGIAVVFSAAIAIGTHREGDPIWIQVLPLVFVFIAFYGWPRTIHSDEKAIWQRTRFGLKRVIPYDEVLAVAYAQGTTTVTGQQATIEHTQYHAGAEQFQSVVSRRSGKQIYQPAT